MLLVEDDQSALNLEARVLRVSADAVLEAGDGERALRIARKHPQRRIDLLLTGVVMPRMSGRSLSERLKVNRPYPGVKSCSGYAGKAVTKQGMLDEEVEFLQKPVLTDELLHKVRDVLEKP